MNINRLFPFIHILVLLRRLQNQDGGAPAASGAAAGAVFDWDTGAGGGTAAGAAILHDHQIVVISREWICPIEADSGRNLCAACNRDNNSIYCPRLSKRKHIQFAGKQYGIRECQ